MKEKLREEIVGIVKNNLPEFSGVNKLLLIILQFGDEKLEVVFWRPLSYTLVAHNYGIPKVKSCEIFNVTARHDSTWKYDGLSFLGKLIAEKGDVLISSSEVITISDYLLDREEKFFTIIR